MAFGCTFASVQVSYQSGAAGWVEIVRDADHVLPPGTTIRAKRVALDHSMSISAGITLHGTAELSSGEELPVRDVIENVAVDLADWQEEHGAMSLPSTKDYVARASVRHPPWCPPRDVD